jgi:hypothetical protein
MSILTIIEKKNFCTQFQISDHCAPPPPQRVQILTNLLVHKPNLFLIQYPGEIPADTLPLIEALTGKLFQDFLDEK